MSALIFSLVAVLLALLVLAVIVRKHMPETGLASWLRESFAGWHSRSELDAIRQEQARLTYAEPAEDDLGVGDLHLLAQDGDGYHQPVDLRAFARPRSRAAG